METTEKVTSTPLNTVVPTKPTSSKNFFTARTLIFLACLFGVLLVAVFSFAIGFSAGIRKANFSDRWDKNYGKHFMNPDGPMGGPGRMSKEMDERFLRSGHGAAGKIIELSGQAITIEGLNGSERSITVTERTKINKKGDPIERSGLELEDRIIVLGKPSDTGTIEADFIRALGKADAEKVESAMKDAGIEPMEMK